jgi:hypothetical protein
MSRLIIALDHGRSVGCAWGPTDAERPQTTSWRVPAVNGLTQWGDHRARLKDVLARSCSLCEKALGCWDGPRSMCQRGQTFSAGNKPLIIFESPLTQSNRPNSQHVFRIHLGLAAITELVAGECGADVFEEPSSTARKAVIGKGTFARPFKAAGRPSLLGPDKGQAKEEVAAWVERQGWEIGSEDARDAALLWAYARIKLAAQAGRRFEQQRRQAALA